MSTYHLVLLAALMAALGTYTAVHYERAFALEDRV